MVDVTVKVLTPATTFDLVSLADVKVMLGIPASDTSNDEALALLITNASAVVSVLTNRVFAKEKVRETWRELDSRRLYLLHWPVKETDIESVVCNGMTLPLTSYELEEESGKLSIYSGQAEPIVVTYTGGFDLPDEAPPALQQAATLFVRASKTENEREKTSGVRSIVHKEARIMFFDTSGGSGSGGASASAGQATLDAMSNLLTHYMRLWA